MSVDGIVVSSGIAFGQALTIRSNSHPLDLSLIRLDAIEAEKDKLLRGINNLIAYLLRCQHHLNENGDHYQLIDADIALLEDSELHQLLYRHITQYRVSASVAVNRIFRQQAFEISEIDNPYIANRSHDILCLSTRLNNALNGHLQWDLSALEHDTILLADDLTPAEFAILPLEHIKGIVLESGGLTSHTAILARSAGIPALLNCPFTINEDDIADGTELIIDALNGTLYIAPNAKLQSHFQLLAQQEQTRHLKLKQFKDDKCQTQDGHGVKLLANIGTLSDISRMNDVGAQGVGLFRTEFILMHANSVPSEQQQYKMYCEALFGLNGLPLTIRTFDIGADKDIPWLNQQHEDNPALGLRGIRFSLANPHIFISQVKAILRAACHGTVKLMFPMVSQIEELEALLVLIEQAKSQLLEQQKAIGNVSIGIVLETPAAILNLPSMLPLVNFVSIGSNDLAQYTLAADRTNPTLANNYPAVSPAILQLISMAVMHCKQADKEISLCGEIGSNPEVLPLLVGLGIDNISINPANLLAVKANLVTGHYKDFVDHAQHVSQLSRIEEISQAVKAYKHHAFDVH
ncbi:phosphoenolpyruvate--protein phosphotransferase [Shewanella intestini]|uniref:Phosphoenolpyruvate-protein phosphotransferase n=1 Tax=Shewanella intestini TaxID=2017544 RepID=A0ABS5I0A8_9GAMM|nr:phosphoenolpyruvate--protein phosphotransferase [Shewanella intestini]MRG35926.1 phosphoenolpyruvate--protein phosphotransferase [Shewanella sp. XMDDZSB0408]